VNRHPGVLIAKAGALYFALVFAAMPSLVARR